MSELQRFKEWIAGYKGLPGRFSVDYVDERDGTGVLPKGPQELARKASITGRVTVTNRLRFALNCTMDRPLDARELGEQNAEWLLALQAWIQEQSVLGLAPVFGNCLADRETIQAENGELYGLTDKDKGLYIVEISITYYKQFGG